MALDPFWDMNRQFTADRGQENPYGLLPAMFLAPTLAGADVAAEFEADLDMHPSPEATSNQAIVGPTLRDALQGKLVKQPTHQSDVLYGVQLLCPRCLSPLYVPSTQHPKPKSLPHEIVVHWDKTMKSTRDGKVRPTFTIVGPIACDYLNSEITGVSQPVTSGISVRCGWVGVIEAGRAYDHSKVKNSGLRAHGQ